MPHHMLPTAPIASPEQIDAMLLDAARLAEIAELELLSPDVDIILSEVAAEAAAHFGLPIGLVTVILDDAQFFAGMHGIDGWAAEARGTPVEWAFCRYTAAARRPYTFADASLDPLHRDNPLVTEMGVRCYAGIPLVSSRGNALGSLCVVGAEPREFDETELAELRIFADRAIARIEGRLTS